MSHLIFDAGAVRRLVEHTISHAAAQRPMAYTTTPVEQPCVVLVHDQGVYLISNAIAPDLADPKDVDRQHARRFVAYASGCNPETDRDWYETARDMVGGDDFAETLPWAQDMLRLLDAGEKTITIRLTEDSAELVSK